MQQISINAWRPQLNQCLARFERRRAFTRSPITGLPAVIAVDGPAAAGKGTLAKKIAEQFNFAHLDTGLLYRAVGWQALQAGVGLEDEPRLEAICRKLTAADLANTALRSDTAASAASMIARLPRVRGALLRYQQQFAESPPGGAPGAVLDGRDVGTRICPDASVKLYVTASAEKRAERRAREFGAESSYVQVLQDILSRDERDRLQSAPAADAYTLDTSEMTAQQAFEEALEVVVERLPHLE